MPPSPATGRFMSKRILVIKNPEHVRGMLRYLLTGSGYTVIEAGDGEAESHRPDLITSRCLSSTVARPPVE